MAYVTIPQLPAGTALTGLEQFEAVQASTSVKLTANQLKAFTSTQATLTINDANNSGVSIAGTALHTVSGTPAIGIGTSFALSAETSISVTTIGSTINTVFTDITSAAENSDFYIQVQRAGTLVEGLRVTSDQFLGIGTSVPITPVQAVRDDATNSSILPVITLTRTTSATPATGIGTGLSFQTETSIGNIRTGGQIAAVVTGTTIGAENFDLTFSVMTAGAAVAEVARLTSTGLLGIGTTNPATAIEAVVSTGTTATIVSAGRFTRTTTGTPAIGIGTAIELATETAINTNRVGASFYSQSTDLTPGVENFDASIGVMSNGVPNVEVIRATSTRRIGINTTSPALTLHAVVNDTVLNSTTNVLRLTHAITGTAANGIGVGMEFEVPNNAGLYEIAAGISAEAADVSSSSEDYDLVFKNMTAGAAMTEKFRIGSTAITPSIQFSRFGSGAAPVASCYIRAGTNSLTIAPMCFDTTAPTLLTTALPGAFDFNNQGLYFTPQGIERGVVATRQVYINTAGTRAGPNAVNTAQTATFTGGSSTITVTTVPGAAVGNTGCLVIFAGTTAPAGITFGIPYWVNWLTATTMNVSTTQGGTPITPTTAGSAVNATFHFPIFGSGTTSVGLSLGANTRYMYEIYFAISHTAAAGTSVAYALTNQTGTLSAHYYRVSSFNSSAALVGNLTSSAAATSLSTISNVVTTNFAAFVTVTGVTAAVANTTNLLQIQGQIDTLTACTYVIPTIGFPVAPTTSTILQGAYMMIYPIGPVVSNTSIGSWVS